MMELLFISEVSRLESELFNCFTQLDIMFFVSLQVDPSDSDTGPKITPVSEAAHEEMENCRPISLSNAISKKQCETL